MSDVKFELPFQFVSALRHARNRFEKHPHWKRLEGTPWENDASVIGADLMSDVARAYEARLALLESVLAEAGEALEPIESGQKMSTGFGVFLQTGGDKSVDEVIHRAASVSNQIAGMKEKSE